MVGGGDVLVDGDAGAAAGGSLRRADVEDLPDGAGIDGGYLLGFAENLSQAAPDAATADTCGSLAGSSWASAGSIRQSCPRRVDHDVPPASCGRWWS
jgi:hypothetical protein